MAAVTKQQQQEQAPVLRIVNADATPEEIAALVAALLAALLVPEAGYDGDEPRSDWQASTRTRTTIAPGLGAWRYSGLCLH